MSTWLNVTPFGPLFSVFHSFLEYIFTDHFGFLHAFLLITRCFHSTLHIPSDDWISVYVELWKPE